MVNISARGESVRQQVHGLRAPERQQRLPAVPGQRAALQLHHAQELPGADQAVPEPAGPEEQGADRQDGAAGERPAEAQHHLHSGTDL